MVANLPDGGVLAVQARLHAVQTVNAEVNFPGSAEVKVPTLVEDVGGQPLSDEGVSVREGRDFRRLAGVGVLAWCGAGMR